MMRWRLIKSTMNKRTTIYFFVALVIVFFTDCQQKESDTTKKVSTLTADETGIDFSNELAENLGTQYYRVSLLL